MLQSITVAIPIHGLTFYGFNNLQSKNYRKILVENSKNKLLTSFSLPF